jgi:hypothetical protein
VKSSSKRARQGASGRLSLVIRIDYDRDFFTAAALESRVRYLLGGNSLGLGGLAASPKVTVKRTEKLKTVVEEAARCISEDARSLFDSNKVGDRIPETDTESIELHAKTSRLARRLGKAASKL